MKRILITGGFGFIGGHLVERLLATTRDHLHVVDDLSTSPLPLDRLLGELSPPKGRLTHSLCRVDEYCAAEPGATFDEIYHLASIVGPAGVIPHMGRIVSSVVNDSERMIELALRSKGRLLDVSTSEVYGGGRDGQCSEDMAKVISSRCSARLEYAVGKLAAETAIINRCRVSKLQACIIRPFNVSGPRQSGKGGFVLPRFVWRAIRKQPLQVFGDGTQVRAFTHVRDIVSGLILAMQKGRAGEVYNLGHPGNKTSIADLAAAVVRIVGSPSPVTFVDPKTIYGPHYEEANDKYPVAEKAMTQLGWQPRYSRDETIADVVAYFGTLPLGLARVLGAEERRHAAGRAYSRV